MHTEFEDVRVWGEPLGNAVDQALRCRRTAERVALMADHHLGYGVPIGGVVAYRGAISPTGVGYDIACGNLAVRLDCTIDDIRGDVASIMDRVWQTISFGVGQKNAESVDHPLFEDDPGWRIQAAAPLKEMARRQLGTVGSGNHYVDLFRDEEGRIWVGVHFGSRGLGHRIATHFLEAGGASNAINAEPLVLDTTSDLGEQYLAGMQLAGRYAYAGREWVCDRVAGIIGADIVEEVHNHHNFAWLEEHDGEELWVVRKGATPAFPGQKGFVGATMGETSVILEGVESEESRSTLYSTVHGAGRIMSRREAAGKRKWGKKGPGQGGKVDWPAWQDRLRASGLELRGGGADEAPECYKRLEEVLDFHGSTVRVLHRLTPIGVAMAGADEFDPYKD